MTIAYTVQVNLSNGIQYVSSNGKLSPIPKFFRSGPAIRKYLSLATSNPSYYNQGMKDLTTVIVIKELEKGLKQSIAEILSYDEFMKHDISAKSNPMISNPRAYYKVKLADGTIEGVSSWRGAARFGKMWSSAGHLRAHLTTQNQYGPHVLLGAKYKDAKIVEVVVAADNVNIEAVREYPIGVWYSASPTSRKHLTRTAARGYRSKSYA